MSETVTYEYQLIAAGMLPLWAGILLGVAVMALVVWLLTGELRSRKRKGPAIRVLKVNRALIALILALLLVQPVLYINRVVTRPAQLVLAADRSRSMLRVDAFDATTLLNLATLLNVTTLNDRPVAAELFNQHLVEHRDELAKFRIQVGAAAADLAQGLPASPVAISQLEEQASAVGALSKVIQGDLAQLGKTAIPASTTQGADASATTKPAASSGDFSALAEKAASNLADLATSLQAAKGKTLTPESADQLVKDYDALIKSNLDAGDALVAVQGLLDKQYLASLKPDARKPLDELGAKSRFEIARMVAQQAANDPVISKNHRVVLANFDPLTSNNAASHTDLYDVIDGAIPKDDDAVLSGLVLFSDGQQNLPQRPEVMRRLTGRGTPFIAAGVGSAEMLPDVAVIDYQVPGVIQRDKKATLIVNLKTQVPPDTVINVTLIQSDGKSLATTTTKPGPGAKATVALDFRISDPGQKVLKVTASMDKPDAAPENDSASIPIYVLDHQARALVIAKWPRWDIVYALQAMADRPLRVDTVFWGESTKAPNRGSSAGSVPDELSTLKRYQVVILDGAPFTGIKPEDSKMFQDYVTNEGGSVVVIDSDDKASYAGAWNWLGVGASSGGDSGATTKPSNDVETPTFTLAPSPNADGYPLTHLAADSAQSRSIWSSLAPVRQAAAVPAQSATLIVRNDAVPVVSLGFRGRGKIYRIGIADLFRSREWSGGAPMTRFLAGVVDDSLVPLFATPDSKVGVYPAAPSLGSPAIAVSLAPEHIEFKPAGAASLPLDLASADKGISPMAEFTVPTVGSFELMEGGASSLTAESIRPLSTEDVDFQLDAPRFTAIANQAGGKYLPLAELPPALKDLAPATERQVTVTQIKLWNLTALVILLAAMLTLDWYLRRKSGLVL